MRYLLILIILVGCAANNQLKINNKENYCDFSDQGKMEQLLKRNQENLDQISELIKQLESD